MSFTSLGDFAPDGVATASLEIQQIFHDVIRANSSVDSLPLVRAKDRARPPPELARLFALDKFIFWRVLSFWRSEREMPVYLMNTDVPAPPEHQFRYG